MLLMNAVQEKLVGFVVAQLKYYKCCLIWVTDWLHFFISNGMRRLVSIFPIWFKAIRCRFEMQNSSNSKQIWKTENIIVASKYVKLISERVRALYLPWPHWYLLVDVFFPGANLLFETWISILKLTQYVFCL